VLRIRKEQMHVFDLAQEQRFVDRMQQHLARWLPSQYHRAGPDETRGFVREGLERARAHGIHSTRGVARYLRVAFIFGLDFERDPQHAWAATILESEALPPEERAVQLHQAAVQILREPASGPGAGVEPTGAGPG
jgi:hypothetical protein